LIDKLPDYGKTPTPHYSGYLDGKDGCDLETNDPMCKIHYWMALSESNPESSPVVLWLNGGPGSSSILGFLQEEGPLMMSAEGDVMVNPYGWTRYANLIAIEAPMGVGYSYCSRQLQEGKPCQNTDRYTASTSRATLVDLFTNKFPELKANNFFIAGESYAGVYIPTLAKEMLDNTNINLKGIAVGDPCTDNKAQAQSMDSLWYAHKYGLVDDDTYHLLWNQCNLRLPNLMTRGGMHNIIHAINKELETISNTFQRKHRAQQLYHEIVLNDNFQQIKHQHHDKDDKDSSSSSLKCTMAFRKFLLSTSSGLSQSWKDLYIDDYSLFAPVTSLEDQQMASYMSRPDVRKALHVEEAPTSTWPNANVGFDYLSEYDACNWNDPIILKGISMVDIYMEIVPKLQRTWIYNGDTDPCVSYEGTRQAVKQILIQELDGGSYRPWFYNQTATSIDVLATKAPLYGPNLLPHNMGPQFGGEVTDYHNGLKFVTFHGSGHMVPQFRPQAALHFLHKFLKGENLSPLLPFNDTLANMTDEEFQQANQQWTESAMNPPYVMMHSEKQPQQGRIPDTLNKAFPYSLNTN